MMRCLPCNSTETLSFWPKGPSSARTRPGATLISGIPAGSRKSEELPSSRQTTQMAVSSPTLLRVLDVGSLACPAITT
jgi:hypothetical protein